MLKIKARINNVIVSLMMMIALLVISGLTSSMNNLVHAAGVQATFYVSPQGNDTNAGTESEPFATIQKARDVIRTINSNMTGDIVVYIRGGKYYLSETITFNESDSGTNGYNIYYKNYTNEEPIIYGGQKVTNWTLDSGNIYKAYVGTGKTFYNLIENDKRATMARFPNSGYLTVESTISGRQYDQFKYRSGDLPSNFDYSNAQVHIWPGESGWNWFTLTDPISHIDSSSRIITLETPFSDSSWIKFDSGARYYVQGSKDFLDTVGEYYLDEDTGYLYYWPKKTPIQNQEIIAPVSSRIFEFKGSAMTNLVKNIQIEGLTLNCSDSTNLFRPYYMNGIDGNEFDEGRNGLIYMENATNNTIKYCKILNAGISGIAMNHYAQHNTAYGNWIESAGYCGVNLVGWAPGEGGFSSAADSYVNKNNTISNNYIYDIGKMVGHASGVYLIQSGDNEVSYNIITKSPRYGVSVKGVRYGVLQSSYYNTAVTWDNHWDFLHSRNNTIKFNDISNIMNDSQDAGAVESWGSGTNNVLDNNLIYNVTSGIAGGLTMGLYLDDAADYWTIKNNIIHSITGSHCYSAYIKGVGHTVTNNIIADNDSHASVYMWAMAGERNDNVTFNKNIFYNTHGSDIYKFADWTDNKNYGIGL